jgi:hypothetical protein
MEFQNFLGFVRAHAFGQQKRKKEVDGGSKSIANLVPGKLFTDEM